MTRLLGGGVFFLLLVLALLELGARAFLYVQYGEPLSFYRRFGYDRAPLTGFEMRPNQAPADSVTLKTRYATNGDGFRGTREYGVKAPGEFRVAVVGESSAFGYGASDDGATIAARLETRLDARHATVINAGNPAYMSYQVLARTQLRVLPREPDVVVVYSGWNDYMDADYPGWYPNHFHGEEIFFSMDSWDAIITDQNKDTRLAPLRHSAALILVRKALGVWRDRQHVHLAVVPGTRVRRLDIGAARMAIVSTTLERNLRALGGALRAQHVTPVYCTLMSRSGVYEDIRAAANAVIRRVAADLGAPLVDVEGLAGTPAPADYFNPDDGYHLSDAGNAFIAAAVGDALAALPAPATP